MTREIFKPGDAFCYSTCPEHRDYYGMVIGPEKAAILFRPITDGGEVAAEQGYTPSGAVALEVCYGCGIPEEVVYAIKAVRVALGLAG